MTETVFVTGAGGFIGQALLPLLLAAPDRRVRALYRRPPADDGAGAETVIGDLLEPAAWQGALHGVDTVIHLAALTGRAPPAAYEAANVAATRHLLDACRQAGVKRFLYVSTIAAGYADQSYYPYARTKVRAEELVRASGPDFAIVRPTLVLGGRSPIWETLSKIAGLPVIPLPQKGRPVAVQPVHVDDVARGLALVLEAGRFQGETFDLGGPDSMTFAAFLSEIHQAKSGKPAKIFAVPLTPIRLMLALMEPLLRPLMPVTAGQLAVFANDSTAAPNWLLDTLRDGMPTTEETIARLSGEPPGDGGAGPRDPDRPLTDDARRTLERECALFGRYLIGQQPSPYVTAQYVRAAAAHALSDDGAFPAFDRAVLGFARRNRLFARWADAYCAIFRRTGPLRRKLVALAAVLEHAAPSCEAFDRPAGRGPAAAVLGLLAHGAGFGVSLLAGTLVCLPLRLLRRGGPEPAG